MRALVFIKQVPDVNEIKFDSSTGRIVRQGVKLLMNSFDKKAVEETVRIKEKYGYETIVASMGPESAMDVIKEAIRMGIDRGILISDRKFGGSDTYVTSKILSAVINIIKPDIVLMGRYSLDGETSQVPPETAYMSGYKFISSVSEIKIDGDTCIAKRDEDNGIRTIEFKLPALISVSEKINRARPVPDIDLNYHIDIFDSNKITGISGSDSLTVVSGTSMLNDSRNCRFISFEEFTGILNQKLNENMITEKTESIDDNESDNIFLGLAVDDPATSMQIASKIAELSNGSYRIVFIGNIDPEKIDGLACHEYIYLGKPLNIDFANFVINYIKTSNVRHILAPSNLNGRDISSFIAASLGLGLTADCVDIKLEDSKMIQFKPAFGGGIIARIESKKIPDFATVRPGMFRVRYVNYNARVIISGIAHSDDIKYLDFEPVENGFPAFNKKIIIGVGRGVARDKIDDIKQIASKINAAIGGTRKVVDMHIIPRQFQIGLTGVSISPALYIAIGISGADNHIVGIRYAGTIIAVNNNRDASIFKHSDYGLVMDSTEFIDSLLNNLNHNKF